ncbi:hypothetical protein, partial [Pontibacillus marinus]|uniref:hypothetical protein n=1 Tax=Pontibacillus marinus TaxID=273164 RepID=UPI001B7FE449
PRRHEEARLFFHNRLAVSLTATNYFTATDSSQFQVFYNPAILLNKSWLELLRHILVVLSNIILFPGNILS